MPPDFPLLPRPAGEPAPPPPEPDVVLVLRPLSCEVPTAIRLRQVLKLLLRRFKMRLMRMEEIPREPS